MLIFLVGFLSTALLYHPAMGWNVNTRLALVFAVADMGTLSIDGYHEPGMPTETGDKAFFEGRFYSDKIVGVSVLALPAYWLARTINGGSLSFEWGHFLSKLWAVSVPAGLGLWLFFLLMAKLGAPPRRALIASVLLFFGSMWFGYSTIFMPYAPALAACLGALYLTFFPLANRLTVLNCAMIGGLLGFALLCELTLAFLVFGLGVVWLLRVADQAGLAGMRAFAEMAGERTRLLHTAIFALSFWVGVLIPMSIFFAYSWTIFGKFTIPYEYEANEMFREGMARGIMGIETPRLGPLYFITVHPYRGLFFWTPILLLAIAGCIAATRQYGKRRIVGWLGLYTTLAYLLFNAGYYMWWGGWCMGPRFLIPVIPILGLGLGELLREGKLSMFERHPSMAKPVRYGVVSLGVLGVALSLPLSLYEPQIPQGNPHELLMDASISSAPAVPQFVYLQAFYQARFGVAPWVRMGFTEPGDPLSNALSVLGFLLIVAGLAGAAYRLLPTALPGVHRRDYPFATVDGAAAPPPPRREP